MGALAEVGYREMQKKETKILEKPIEKIEIEMRKEIA